VFRNFYEKDPKRIPPDWFLTTSAPECLVPRVLDYYRRVGPKLPRLFSWKRAKSVYLDVHGSVYGSEMATIRVPRGYAVTCPLSHAHAVCSMLRDRNFLRVPPIGRLRPIVLVHGMYGIGALYEEDAERVASGLAERAEEGSTLYESRRLAALASGHVADGRLSGQGIASDQGIAEVPELPASSVPPGTRVRVTVDRRPAEDSGVVLTEGWDEVGGCLVLHDDGKKYGWGWNELTALDVAAGSA
jgi:hypothetical protein